MDVDAEVSRATGRGSPSPTGSPFAMARLQDALVVCEGGDPIGRASPVSAIHSLKLEPMPPTTKKDAGFRRSGAARGAPAGGARMALPPITPRTADDARSPRGPAEAWQKATPLAPAMVTPTPTAGRLSFFDSGDDAVAAAAPPLVTPSPRGASAWNLADATPQPRRPQSSAAPGRPVKVPPLERSSAPPPPTATDDLDDFDASPRPSARKSFSPRAGPGRRAGQMSRSTSLAALH